MNSNDSSKWMQLRYTVREPNGVRSRGTGTDSLTPVVNDLFRPEAVTQNATAAAPLSVTTIYCIFRFRWKCCERIEAW